MPPTTLLAVTPNLCVEDVDASLDFYRALGFSLLQKVPERGAAIWAHVQRDGVRLMFQRRGTLIDEFPILAAQPGGGALTLWIQADDVRELYGKVAAQPFVLKPLGVTDYNNATEFVLLDPDGFILHFTDLDLSAA